MTRLNQVIAIEKGTKARATQEQAQAIVQLQKPQLLAGIARTYRPKDEEGDQLPPESTKVQVKAEQVLAEQVATLTRLFDVTATKDWANCRARANVVVDGKPVLSGVPVTYLLFLEKQLDELTAFVKKLPMLDPAETWAFDPSADCYATEPVTTVKTKKIPRNHVKVEATDKHPAQVDVFYEDVVTGWWRTVKFSGALPAKRVNGLLERIAKVREAVQFAREEANALEIEEQKIGEKLFEFLTT